MAQQMSRAKKTFVIGAVAVLSLAGAGAALAYWTSTGTGVGEAQTGEAAEFVIDADPAEGDLAPGSSQTVAFTVSNPGPGTLYFDYVTVGIANPDGSGWVPDGSCLGTDYSATVSTHPDTGSLSAGSGVEGVVTVTMRDSVLNQDDCQGQSVPLYFSAYSTGP